MARHSPSLVLSFLVLICLFGYGCSVPSFNFYEYLTGEWEISRSIVKFGARCDSAQTAAELTANEQIRSHFTIQKHNSTVSYSSGNSEDVKDYSLILSGVAFDNDTAANNEIIHEREIRFFFDSPTTGVAKAGIDEDSLRTLFHFDFHSVSAGIALSSGKFYSALFAADEQVFYTLNIGAMDRFTLTVFPRQWDVLAKNEKMLTNELEPVHPFEAAGTPQEIQNYKETEDDEDDADRPKKTDSEKSAPSSSKKTEPSSASSSSSGASVCPHLVVYSAKKVIVPPAKTWWQTYFPFLAIFAFMAIQIYVKSKTTSSALSRQMSSVKKTPTAAALKKAN